MWNLALTHEAMTMVVWVRLQIKQLYVRLLLTTNMMSCFAPLAKENTQAVGRSVRAWLLVVLDGSPHRSRRSLSSIQRWIGDKTGATRDNFHANDNKNELVAISEHKNDQVRGAHALCALL
jgi:hypothetical protein